MKQRIQRLVILILLVSTLVSCGSGDGGSAGAAPQALMPWTGLYDGLNTLFLPYANGPISTASPPTIYAQVGNGTFTSFGMDTGSTGTVVSQELFEMGPEDAYVGAGSISYSSSGIVWNGDVYRSTVTFMPTLGVVSARARVNILVVKSQTCLPNPRDCTPSTPSNPPSNIHFMGIGFNSGVGFTQSVVAAAENNPFTNLIYVKDFPLDTMRKGWILTNVGVYLGMSTELTKNFAFVKLDQNLDTLGSSTPLWQSAPAAIGVNGVVKQGVSLIDTGVGEMLLSPAAANGYSSGDMPLGVSVEVLFPSQKQPQPAFYNFMVTNVSNPGPNPMTPGTVIVSNDTSGIVFVNTGRNFLQGFNYLYDAVSGYVGYGDNGNILANPYRQVIATQ